MIVSREKVFSILKYLLFLFIGVGLLYYVTKGQDFFAILREFREAKYAWLILSMFLGVLSHVARAARWNLLINSLGYKTRTSTTFYAVMIGYFANLVVPRMGEITRCGVLSKANKVPLNTIIGTVVVERGFDMLCLIALIFMVIFFQFELLDTFVHKYVITPVSSSLSDNYMHMIIGLIVIAALVVLGVVLRKYFRKIIKSHSSFNKVRELIIGFINGVKSINKMERKGYFLFLTFIIWALYLLMLYVCFFAMTATSHLGIIDGLTVMAIGSLGIVAPVPGGIGAYHFIVKTVLVELFVISSDAAISFAYLVHASQTVMIIVVGAFSMLLIFFERKKSNNVEI